MVRVNKLKVFLILGLFASGLLLGASLWNIDWAIWFHHFYLFYIPFVLWGVKVSGDKLGFWVNIQYLQIVIAFIIAIVCTYKLSRSRP